MSENYMDYYSSPEEFIRVLCTSRSEYSIIDKNGLMEIAANDFGISVNWKMTKSQIYELILEKASLEEFADMLCCCGVRSGAFQQKFVISHQEVKRMAHLGFIRITGHERVRFYGKYNYVDLYSVFDYFRLTKEEVHKWLEANPKGTKKAKSVSR